MKTEKLPLPDENPKGLHGKYLIKKFSHMKSDTFGWGKKPVFKHVDPFAEYFVLRLDEHQKDKKHRDACISAVLHYAEQIKDHLPELSQDLIKRYGGK